MAIMAGLGLVLTVDTSVAHLAGAMGVPVWILLPWCSEWRWLRHRTDSPWYPTARLFRQPGPNDWRGARRAGGRGAEGRIGRAGSVSPKLPLAGQAVTVGL